MTCDHDIKPRNLFADKTLCTNLLFPVQSVFDNILLFNNQLIICTHLLQLGGF